MANNKENSNKMKGLLKGLRYISQIFDDTNKEQEMQIGFPTDVKHVAHIGWDGPSTATSPSWMNEFASPPGFASAPLGPNGELKEDNGIKWVSEDSGRRGSRSAKSPAHDSPDMPKSSRSRSSRGHGGGGGGGGGGTDSPKMEKSDKPRQTRRASRTRDTSDGSNRGARQQATDSSQRSESQQNLPDIPKRTRRKKSKESFIGESSSRRSKDPVTPSTAKRNSIEPSQNPFQEGEDREFT
ncbi:hypothetical protein M0R45_010570 [Rubus argutus]|uniref:CRIB domain-containing protein n=1 Tax=Rubus argutus TaxID=59490 RepID=A0AAW1Y7G8_RUBAR